MDLKDKVIVITGGAQIRPVSRLANVRVITEGIYRTNRGNREEIGCSGVKDREVSFVVRHFNETFKGRFRLLRFGRLWIEWICRSDLGAGPE